MLIIDGHNLIGKSADIRLSDPKAKELILSKLDQFQKINNCKTIIVFDGRGFGNFQFYQYGQIEIIYPLEDQTADEVIKNLIDKYRGDSGVKLITSDNDLLNYAKKCKIKSEKSHIFISYFQKTILESSEKNISSDQNNLQSWLDYFQKND